MNKIWIKVVLAISLDGRISLPTGGKAQLGSKGDRKVLEESLAWADATLMGGETLRIHKNTCLIHEEEFIRTRILEKRPDQPISLVVTQKQNHHLDWPFFKQPINRWIVSSKKNVQEMDPPEGYDHFVELKPTWAETFNEFIKSGLTKIVILGGAKLVGSLLVEDQIDELQLTLTPKLLGGEHSWTPYEINNLPSKFSKDNAWIIKEIKEMENNEIMLRYLKKESELSLYKKNN